jgi:hypothetical protein
MVFFAKRSHFGFSRNSYKLFIQNKLRIETPVVKKRPSGNKAILQFPE